MKRLLIRYKVAPERAQENRDAITRVFAALHDADPGNVQYAAFQAEDGVTFFHVVTLETSENPIGELPAFQAFQAGLRERCVEQPMPLAVEAIGTYRCFDA